MCTDESVDPVFVVEEFLKSFPEFNQLNEDTIQFYGDISYDLLPLKIWSDKWHMRACYLLTAHNLAMRFPIEDITNEDGSITPLNDVNNTIQVTSHSAGTGSLSESGTAIVNSTDADTFTANLSQTRYGLMLLSLMDVVLPKSYLVRSK